MQQTRPASVQLFERAMHHYRECLAYSEGLPDLRADAAYNLEVAKLLWLKAKAEAKDPANATDPKDDPKTKSSQDPQTMQEDPRSKKGGFGKKIDKGGLKKENGAVGDEGKDKIGGDKLFSLPDTAELAPLTPEQTADLLEQAAQRILSE